MPRFYYEDFETGQVRTSAPRTITREEIVAFASEFDPQPFHLDEAAGRNSILGGLAASGWHTCAFMFRMTYDEFIKDTASLGSPGIDEVKWLKPVRPGMKLKLRRAVLDKRVSNSRPDRGLVRFKSELLDESGEPVIEQTNIVLIRVRNPEAA